MSELLPALQQGPFEYVSVAYLRQEGLTAAMMDDPTAIRKIREASDTVNTLTGQVFVPLEAVVRVDGRNSALVWLPNQMRLIRVDTVEVITIEETGSTWLVDPALYVVKKHWIESISPASTHWKETMSQWRVWQIQHGRPFRFPEVPNGVRITGVFGWVDRQREVTLTVSAPAAIGAETVTVADVLDIAVNDVLILPDPVSGRKRRLVTAVDSGTKVISFALQPLRTALATAALLKVHGVVPSLLQRAVALLVVKNRYGLADPRHVDERRSDRIKSEKTDNYSYTMSSGGGGASGGWDSSKSLTGCEEADQILTQFVPPATLASV